MSFAIILQTNNSPPNAINKNIVDVATATGSLRTYASIQSPSITIDSVLTDEILSLVNYCYIAAFKRYYYIDEITTVQNHLWNFAMHVDVLMSFKDQILANSGIIRRQYARWDLYLDDGTFRTDQDPLIGIRTFPNGFDHYEWVLAVAGNQGGLT